MNKKVPRQYNLMRLFRRLICAFASNSYLLTSKSRRLLYKYGGGIKIGRDTFIGRNVYFDELAPESITIGKCCHITQGVQILTHFISTEDGCFYTDEIIIDDNTFIGMNTIITKPIKIGKNCIIGAGSIVTHDIPDNSIACGNPCKVIKTR